ncbi:MAG: bifunctional nuclease family protein, partial [Desulfovibrionaceae bacterium]|nr:bifunctional nuclease family protein [Desulfovibrionaceae bacterium]
LENGETRRLDCRPSDAVALALRAKAPIRASKAVLRRAADLQRSAAESGEHTLAHAPIQKLVVALHADKDADPAAGHSVEQDRFSELLRSLEPESKRKM